MASVSAASPLQRSQFSPIPVSLQYTYLVVSQSDLDLKSCWHHELIGLNRIVVVLLLLLLAVPIHLHLVHLLLLHLLLLELLPGG
jgi:hypothetical protein